MLILFLAATNAGLIGEFGVIDTVSGLVCTMNHDWSASPSSGDTAILLVPGWRAQKYYVKAEIEGAGYSCQGMVHWFGVGLTNEVIANVVTRANPPRPLPDGPLLLQAPTSGASSYLTYSGAIYRHCSTIERFALGGVGCKFELLTAPADSKKVSVWLGVG
jgi:hypothetical protein